jgi:hypothetical protein
LIFPEIEKKVKPLNNLLNQQFDRLTVISRAPNPGTRKNDTAAYWNCLCSCGKTCIIRGYSLTSGKTKSCGCLKKESPHLAPFSLPKYSPEIAAAKVVWKLNKRYTTLLFDDFYRLSQMSCVYCGDLPSLRKQARQKDQSSIFIYNTLDRVNSSLGHTIDNVVPACLICNRTKLNRSVSDFYNHISQLIKNINWVSPQKYRQLTTTIDIIFLKDVKEYNRIDKARNSASSQYIEGDITLEQFYQLTASNCYYCEQPPSNKRLKNWGAFIYNGLDRLDSSLPHNYDNVVPCCKWCNTAKGQLTLTQFKEWIARLVAHPRQTLQSFKGLI